MQYNLFRNVTINTIILCLLSCSSSFCSEPNIRQELSFKIYSGKTIKVKITDEGPYSEDDKIKVESVGFRINPSKSKFPTRTIRWEFMVKSKTKNKIKQISVFEVYSTNKCVNYTICNNPNLINGIWTGTENYFEPSKKTFPQLFTPGETVMIFKIVVNFDNGKKSIIYRPMWLSQALKLLYLNKIGLLQFPAA